MAAATTGRTSRRAVFALGREGLHRHTDLDSLSKEVTQVIQRGVVLQGWPVGHLLRDEPSGDNHRVRVERVGAL